MAAVIACRVQPHALRQMLTPLDVDHRGIEEGQHRIGSLESRNASLVRILLKNQSPFSFKPTTRSRGKPIISVRL